MIGLIGPTAGSAAVMAVCLGLVLYFGVEEAEAAAALLVLPSSTIWILLAARVIARRLHDINLSDRHLAWLLPIAITSPAIQVYLRSVPFNPGPGILAIRIVTFAALAAVDILFLVLLLRPGSPDENRYGPPPR